ncbi:transposase, partial [Salmonella enterica]|nr:transposase [Salmonella enterica]
IHHRGIFELQAAKFVVSAHGGLRKSVTKTVAA